MTTPDQAALEIMLDTKLSTKQRDAKLEKLFKHVSDVTNNRLECPECGDMGPHDDNGCSGYLLTYCCLNCGSHFEPVSG